MTLWLLGSACTKPVEKIEVTMVTTGPEHAVRVSGLSSVTMRTVGKLQPNDRAWPRVLGVYVDQPGTPPIIGRYAVTDGGIRFMPRFPFAAGVSYRIELDTSALTATLDPKLIRRFTLPATVRARTTRVVSIHPSSPTLPSNLLRWYVEFSAPMETGAALSHVHLMDEAGREVTGAFLALDQELWDPERRRITLLFDPGRVKRGVRTNMESGAPLVAGRRYRLVIDDRWPDGDGAPLASGAERAFEAIEADRVTPDPTRWRLTPPTAGTGDAFRVQFGEPLDHALASRMLAVHDARGIRLAGSAQLTEHDDEWLFTPDRAWVAGEYTLRVDRALEDVAGNSVAQVFDIDRRVDTTLSRSTAGESVTSVRFRVQSASR